MYLRIILFLHVLGAILGFGPTAAFGLLTSLGERLGGEARQGIMEGVHAVATKMATPFDLLQPLTGVLLIFKLGLNKGFFTHEWLWIGILLYFVMMGVVHAVALPTVKKIVTIERHGDPNDPALAPLYKKFKAVGGGVIGPTLLAIIVLMVTKPGG